MSELTPEEETRKSQRRVRKYYEIASEREWERLVLPEQGALEFTVNKAWMSRYLPSSGSRVLDLGGGPGRYSMWLAERGYRVVLADLSPALLDVAREKIKEAGLQLEAIVEANAINLAAFEDASFDAVLCMGPLYHLTAERDRQAAVAEVLRVVKPGGVLFAAFLNRLQIMRVVVNEEIPFFTPFTFDLVKRWQSEGVFISPVPGIFTDTYSFHPSEVVPFMESAGFETLNLISSQGNAADVQRHFFSFAERQPELHPWVEERIIELANEPSIVGSGFHMMYIGRRP